MSSPQETIERSTAAPGSWWAPWLLATFTVLICLIAGELILRQWFPVKGVLLQRDARYLYKYVPGARSRTVYVQPPGTPPEESILVTINREGRRGEAVAKDAS